MARASPSRVGWASPTAYLQSFTTYLRSFAFGGRCPPYVFDQRDQSGVLGDCRNGRLGIGQRRQLGGNKVFGDEMGRCDGHVSSGRAGLLRASPFRLPLIACLNDTDFKLRQYLAKDFKLVRLSGVVKLLPV
jgi:hypothetical protein